MKNVRIICLLAVLACMGCKREKTEVKTVAAPAAVMTSDSGTDVVSRIRTLYEDIFSHYNRGDFSYSVRSVFSARLRGFWSQLPDNELVYSANIWTDLQDFDSLAVEMVSLDSQNEDTAMVTVRFRAFGDDLHSVQIRTVRESLRGNLDWYVDDIIHPHRDEPFSIARMARGYAADSIAYYLWEYDASNLHDEDNVIELRFRDSVVVDGFFWGTSDEFYSAREGFYPGFSVWRMQDIGMAGDTLTFLLDSRGTDYFSGPLALDVHSVTEALQDGYSLWRQYDYSYFQDSIRYTSVLGPDTLLVLKDKSGWPYPEDHPFVRKTAEEIQEVERTFEYEEENRRDIPE